MGFILVWLKMLVLRSEMLSPDCAVIVRVHNINKKDNIKIYAKARHGLYTLLCAVGLH